MPHAIERFDRPVVYWSDTHIGHPEIVSHTHRPFATVDEMDACLVDAMRFADLEGWHIMHMGDVAQRIDEAVLRWGPLAHPERHRMVPGNHDHASAQGVRRSYYRWFGRLLGDERTWMTNTHLIEDRLDGRLVRVLLSHLPQQDLRDADINCYGHFHDHWARSAERFAREWPWLAASSAHYNVSVEWLGYQPRRLEEIVAMRSPSHVLR